MVLWLVQICYLDVFYKMIKTSEAKSVTAEAIHILQEKDDEDDISEEIDELSAENGMAILVTDAKGNIFYNAEYIATSKLNTMPTHILVMCYEKAKNEGGFTKLEFEGSINKTFGENAMPQMPMNQAQSAFGDNGDEGSLQEEMLKEPGFGGQFIQNHGQDLIESVIYVNIVQVEEQEYLLLVNSQLTPVDATVQTLRIELVWITIVMVCLSLVIALLISRQISKSFIKINDSAKEMTKGNYDVVFEGNDYLEIAELSDTLNTMAVELNKNESFRRELIANVSHDLRTPLTMIIAYAEVMRDLPGENSPENVQVVIDEAERLTNLVNDMLDISKLQAGVMQMNASVYNLTESIQSVFARYNKLKEQDGYTINFIYDKKVIIEADEYKIFQVIYNLVNNAINYTGEDKAVMIRQKIINDIVRIEVEDSGEGIEPEAIPYVWDRYYKVDKTHKRAIMGTGLGLSIVKNILELHHARYGVESVVGEGSTFWFELAYKEIEE